MRRLRAEGKTLKRAAMLAGMDVKTARKYENPEKLPSEMKKTRAYRTRRDDFLEVWPEIEEFLNDAPGSGSIDHVSVSPGKVSWPISGQPAADAAAAIQGLAIPPDRLTAAVKQPGQQAGEFMARYTALLKHYGIQGRPTNSYSGNENGDVEQSHHRLKRRLEQQLLLRGSRDFASRGNTKNSFASISSGRIAVDRCASVKS